MVAAGWGGCYNGSVQYRPFGSSGVKVSAIGLGSWLTIGNAIDDKSSQNLVAHAFEKGVNLFDTADVYNNGEGERALGLSIKDLPRHELVVATKCFFPMSDDVNDRGLSRKHIHESIKKSLQRLSTDYVDLYQCHRFDPEVPIRETALAMHDLIQQGHILYWGVSMWPAERIAEVAELCRFEVRVLGVGCQSTPAPGAHPPPSLRYRPVEGEPDLVDAVVKVKEGLLVCYDVWYLGTCQRKLLLDFSIPPNDSFVALTCSYSTHLALCNQYHARDERPKG